MTLEEYLVANEEVEKLFKKYVIENASEALKEKILAAGYEKNIGDASNYIKNEAYSRATNGCTFMTDPEVYGLLMHYFEEDSIKRFGNEVKGDVKSSAKKGTKEQSKNEDVSKNDQDDAIKDKVVKKSKKQQVEERPSLFDFM